MYHKLAVSVTVEAEEANIGERQRQGREVTDGNKPVGSSSRASTQDGGTGRRISNARLILNYNFLLLDSITLIN